MPRLPRQGIWRGYAVRPENRRYIHRPGAFFCESLTSTRNTSSMWPAEPRKVSTVVRDHPDIPLSIDGGLMTDEYGGNMQLAKWAVQRIAQRRTCSMVMVPPVDAHGPPGRLRFGLLRAVRRGDDGPYRAGGHQTAQGTACRLQKIPQPGRGDEAARVPFGWASTLGGHIYVSFVCQDQVAQSE